MVKLSDNNENVVLRHRSTDSTKKASMTPSDTGPDQFLNVRSLGLIQPTLTPWQRPAGGLGGGRVVGPEVAGVAAGEGFF